MRLGHAVLLGAVGAAIAGCGSSSSGGGPGSGTSQTSDAACTAVFEQLSKCTGELPTEEIARLKPRYLDYCKGQMALPGSGMTADSLAACAKDLAANPIGCVTRPPSCAPNGSLAENATCNEGFQCQSGSCTFMGTQGPGGVITISTCGTCAAGIQCNADGGACPSGTLCVLQSTGAACVPVVYGQAGAACGTGPTDQCAVGLACGSAGKCVMPVATGGACAQDTDCSSGYCDGANCIEPTFVAAGQPCGAGNKLCIVGLCPFTSPAVCPTVLADGAPCDPGDSATTCDTLSECQNGTCELLDALVCK